MGACAVFGMAFTAARSGDVEAMEDAINEDAAALVARDKLSRTPLHLAAWAGHAKVVALLIERGANINAEAIDGIRAIHFAAQNGHETCVKELLKARSKVNVRDTKKLNTPLHMAASRGHASLVAYLLRKNADPNAVNRGRKTPVDVASSEEIRQIFRAAQKGEDMAESTSRPGGTSVADAAKADVSAKRGADEEGADERGSVEKGAAENVFSDGGAGEQDASHTEVEPAYKVQRNE